MALFLHLFLQQKYIITQKTLPAGKSVKICAYYLLNLKQPKQCSVHFGYDIPKMFFILGELVFIAIDHQ